MILDVNKIWTIPKSRIRNINYPVHGNANYAIIEKKSFWFKHRNSVISTIIGKHLFKHDFCDIGGGNGYQCHYLQKKFKNKKFYLVEPGYNGCLNARKNNIKHVYHMNFAKFPIHKFSIDGIGLFDVLEHIENDYKFMSLISKKLKPNTKIYLSMPAHNILWSETDDYGKHYRRYTKQMIIKLAQKCNLQVLYQTYYFSYLIPFILMFRTIPYLLGRRLTNQQIINNETNQHITNNKLLNFFINKFNRWEISLIKSNSILYGASLFSILKVKK